MVLPRPILIKLTNAVQQCFPNFFPPRGPLIAMKNNKILSRPCSRKHTTRMLWWQTSKIKNFFLSSGCW